MAISIFYFLIILTLILYIFLLCGGYDSLMYYTNDYLCKVKYNRFKNELISNKWYYDIRTYNEKRKCVLSLYDDMTYTLSINRKDSNSHTEITVMEEGVYDIINVELKSPMCRVDLIGNDNNNQRFDMILYNKKNKDKIDVFRKGVDFYDNDDCVVFYRH